MDLCYVCLNLHWDVFSAEKDQSHTSRTLRITWQDLDDGVEEGCATCSIFRNGFLKALDDIYPPSNTSINLNKRFMVYLAYFENKPLQMVAYVPLIDSNRISSNQPSQLKITVEFFTSKCKAISDS